jgi:hypothetical protein
MPMTETCDDGGVDNDCDGNPNNGVDCDDDKIPDDVEIAIGTDPNDKDSDDDGVIDGEEIPKGSTTFDLDSDDDGKINALDPDSDNDGLKDGTELGLGCGDPATNLEAGNCTPDGDGGATTTNPLDPDTDKGGVNDGDEDTDKDGVVDEGERDPNVPGDDKATTPQCTQDSDCGGPTSGKVCNAENTCQDGCRGTGGNGCPATQECSSKDDTIGTCSDVEQPGTIIFGEGSGLCAVQQPGNDNGSASAAWLLGLVALARVVARRRKAG